VIHHQQDLREGFVMKYLTLLATLLCLAGCGGATFSNSAIPSNSNTGGKSVGLSNSPTQFKTYDMLSWMTMDPSLRTNYHMSGSANPVYTSVLPDRFFWTKSSSGFPWDIQLYDDNYIYLWVTELDWQNPNSFKVFNSPAFGQFNLPLVPRFARGGYPGSTIKISDSTFEIHSDCDTFTSHNLGHVINEVWGPYHETLGGELPPNLETLVISYRYNCDANYGHCGDKEEYHLARPYGLVKWQHEKLQSDGTYASPDNVTYMNRVVSGQVQPVTTCF
jgi:hypothetical protein